MIAADVGFPTHSDTSVLVSRPKKWMLGKQYPVIEGRPVRKIKTGGKLVERHESCLLLQARHCLLAMPSPPLLLLTFASSADMRLRTNAVTLLGCYLILVENYTAE
eukprot:768339-Hanusia_phi.AAC.1